MERILQQLQPERVFYYFEQLCRIPHGSGNVGKVADYLVFFAKLHALECERDEANNVILRKDATAGYENLPTVILQGHTDMVCAKTPESTHDFVTDALRLQTDGKTVWADGTTLGGDDGIAVAMMLAILESDEAAHPALEAVFTSDEEIGLLGAKRLDLSRLRGRLLLNLDSEDEGVLTVSCAGGSVTTVRLPFACEEKREPVYRVTVTGLTGGHSGAEIHKGRANAAVLAGRLLCQAGISLSDIKGGEADNAIMRECVLTVCGQDVPQAAKRCEADFRSHFPKEDIRLLCEPLGETQCKTASLPLAEFLSQAPYGVQSMSKEIDGLVQTSLNLGIIQTEQDAFVLTYSVRSSSEKEKNELNARLHTLAEAFGGSAETSGEYPAWEYRKDSPLREHMIATFEKLYGRKPRVEAIHAGLECGLFAGGIPGLDAVSYGPDMKDIHTARESLSVASVERTYLYTLAVLKGMKSDK